MVLLRRFDGDGPLSGDGVTGVDDEVDQHLLQLTGVDQDVGKVRSQDGLEDDVLAQGAMKETHQIGDGAVHVQHRRTDQVTAGEHQELAGQFGGASARLADLGQVLPAEDGRVRVPRP